MGWPVSVDHMAAGRLGLRDLEKGAAQALMECETLLVEWTDGRIETRTRRDGA